MSVSEISKLYENAGFEVELGYPPFTAEKQIELIKWLSDFADFGTFSIDHDKSKSEYGIAFCVNDDGHYFVDSVFEECIAKSVSYLWQSLTKEKQQIKEILE